MEVSANHTVRRMNEIWRARPQLTGPPDDVAAAEEIKR
jgi:hypothetical protein